MELDPLRSPARENQHLIVHSGHDGSGGDRSADGVAHES